MPKIDSPLFKKPLPPVPTDINGAECLLSPDLERLWFRRLERARINVSKLTKAKPTPESKRELKRWRGLYLHCRNYLVACNYRLLIQRAKVWAQGDEEKIEEYVSANGQKLIRSVERFRLRFKTKFSTYACASFHHEFMRQHGKIMEHRNNTVHPTISMDSTHADERESGQETTDIREAIEHALQTAKLTGAERAVIHHRFFEHKKLREVGLVIGVTRERVRQIEEKALKKLRGCLPDLELEPAKESGEIVQGQHDDQE